MKKRGKKLSPLAGPDTLNAETWGLLESIVVTKKISVGEARIVQAVALLPFDKSGNVLRELMKPFPDEPFRDEPKTTAEWFMIIYRRAPATCLEVLSRIDSYMRGRSETARAIANDFASEKHESAEKLAEALAKKGILSTGEAITKARKRLRTLSSSLHASEAEEIESRFKIKGQK